ncbi:UPF0182 family protein [Lyngbya aestuarii]|uniref:UPF0182 family protein n=1 Tax=Lyngbya aestuarii TaxID=118322 RepID=UPI00403D74AF
MSRRLEKQIFRLITLLLGLWLTWDFLSYLVAEILWFNEVGYLPVFRLRLQTQIGTWTVVFILSAGFLLSNLFLANRLKYPKDISASLETRSNASLHKPDSALRSPGVGVLESTVSQVKTRPQANPSHHTWAAFNLPSLLPLVLCLCVLVGIMLLHYGEMSLELWHPDWNLPNITPTVPPPLGWATLQQLLFQQLPEQIWQLGFLLLVVIALMLNPQFWLAAAAVSLSLVWSLILSGQWGRILRYFYPTAFNAEDPLFGNDISFYIFSFPLWRLLDVWLGGLFVFGLLAVLLTYLVSGDSLSQGKFPGLSQNQLRHLYGLTAAAFFSIALRYWLSRYELLYSPRGVAYGASYTDVQFQLPVNTGLSILAVAIAIFLLLRMIFWLGNFQVTGKAVVVISALYFTVVVVTSVILPATVQRLSVQPNELDREQPYIERSIALTRTAFDLDSIDARIFNPEGKLSRADLDENILTIRNIRLWDSRPILQTNRQLQRIRLYYEFPDADIDRYILPIETRGISPSSQLGEGNGGNFSIPDSPALINREKQQVIISPRELQYQAVPQSAQTWVNKHLVYTHGYGFTLSPVNRVGDGGLPNYYVKDIGTGANSGVGGDLSTSSELIDESIPIGTPRIYYGELTDNYVMTPTKVRELDYPSGQDNVYNTYDGTGGVTLGSIWRRLLFAQYLKDWQMLFTRNFIPQTKVLLRRDINQRIRAIAPFLRYDGDPYIVTANAEEAEAGAAQNYLYWIVDAYTTSESYPYSDPGEYEFNYIRNSVKVVIDAYNGNVSFYVAAPEDPIIQTWDKIFPGMFKPLSDMPAELLRHIRYPVDIFSIQSERLLTYHMTDPNVFYNREDQWRIPQEIYGTEPQSVKPYYLIMKLPTAASEEFILLHPFTPVARNNLIAWLAGRSDGINYGKLLLYQFPKQELIYGPEQIEALINQDPAISEQISLWNRQGSRAVQGNLLVIPIERSLLYVEPLYLEAERNSLPTLVRVIVVYENRIVMAPTLEEALNAIFEPEPTSAPTIIRPLDELPLP